MIFKNLHKNILKIKSIIIFSLLFISKSVAAGESDFPPNYYDTVALILLVIIVIALLSIIYYEGKPKTEVVKEKKVSVLAKIRQALTKSTPIEREQEIMLDHDYDGIKELDSKIPPWFSWLFVLTILFGVYYMLNYHVFATGKLSHEEYEQEMSIAAAEKEALIKSGALVNEETVTQLTDAADLQSGKQIFETNCIACHAADGGGIVGPNLADKYWIHGGGIKNVFKTIKYGVPEKGMISWQSQLNAKQIQDVASYVLSLQGTKPANPKPPEGEIWKEEPSE
ncbi:MAG: c-type cytochrome [Ignavibacteriaceae bacterium]|nr:c-type cytochrome [Ignavibacteriaceae bacterium]MCW8813478.1 c-type cytochrome [Chlorobium sp.]MCW8817374.1 c-type cytochrome [Ignavibacteriaceae bacterium]MCW8824156.1 c-type cytochrome [Ignavibacteriaceae bacterium]MCW9094418.1 c-type cytochrome [Ignavibacteriaceae bacterium]